MTKLERLLKSWLVFLQKGEILERSTVVVALGRGGYWIDESFENQEWKAFL